MAADRANQKVWEICLISAIPDLQFTAPDLSLVTPPGMDFIPHSFRSVPNRKERLHRPALHDLSFFSYHVMVLDVAYQNGRICCPLFASKYIFSSSTEKKMLKIANLSYSKAIFVQNETSFSTASRKNIGFENNSTTVLEFFMYLPSEEEWSCSSRKSKDRHNLGSWEALPEFSGSVLLAVYCPLMDNRWPEMVTKGILKKNS